MLDQSPDKGQMGSKTGQIIDRDELLSMELGAYSNMVMVKVEKFKEDRKTKAGIILTVNPDTQYLDGDGSHMADMTIVRGVCEKAPSGLLPDGDLLPWHTEVEVVPGDELVWDYMDARNATSFICDEDEYMLLPYGSIYAVIRGDGILGVNGYILFTEVMKERHSLTVSDEVDLTKGKVYALAQPVEYTADYWQDGIDVQVGDIVEFRSKASRVLLERTKHLQTLPDRLFRHQRRDFAYVHKTK